MASLLGALGVVFLLFALSHLLLGLIIQAPTSWSWIVSNAIAGLVLLGIAGVMGIDAMRERMSSGEARRVGKYGTSALASTLIGIVILLILGFFAHRNSARFDWSEAGLHSLSEQTQNILTNLEQEAQVTAFFARTEHKPVRTLLERYAYVSDKFRFEVVDPNDRPDLVRRFAIDRERLGQGLVRVALGDDSSEVDEVSEESITNALVKLQRTSSKKIYFLEGHGERPATGEGAEQRFGYSRAVEALGNENYQADSLLLLTTTEVPEDADALVVAAAKRPLLAEEARAIELYLERGGALLLLVDPDTQSHWPARLEDWGVQLGQDVILDYLQALFGRAATPVAEQYAPHPITESMREQSVFHEARSVKPREDAKDRFTEIVLTSANSWGETNLGLYQQTGEAQLDGDDLQGPVSVAVAGSYAQSDDENAGRIVVFGDSDFASNELFDAAGNRDLFLNSVNWLLGDVEAISIRPPRSRASRFNPTEGQLSTIRNLSLFALPEVIAILGALAWWQRRRAPGR